jgi:hypothetical protein
MKKRMIVPVIACLSLVSCAQKTTTSSSESETKTNETTTAATTTSETSQTTETASSEEPLVLRDVYASPTGLTTAKGTEDDPYSIEQAIEESTPGHHLYLLEGTYKLYNPLKINSLTELHPAANEAETKFLEPVTKTDGTLAQVAFDCRAMGFGSANRGISFNTNWWHARNFELYGAGDNGVYIGGNHNIIEHLRIHDNQDTGLQLGRRASSDTTIDTWPTDNLILNCTSYDNFDPTGENADGFACKLTTGYGNVFDGCISYNNSDDGWDLYTKAESGPIGPVTIKNCIAFNNGMTTQGVGTANSDGNGFKLGGEVIPVSHKVINCLAFNNCAHGFTDNSNPGTISLTNCTSYNNGVRDWDCGNINLCRDATTSHNVFKNILSYCEGHKTSNVTGKTTLANSKDQYKGAVSYSVFYSGLAMHKFTTATAGDYSKEATAGDLVQETVSDPFVSAVTPQAMSSKGVPAATINDIHTLLRAADGSVKLGDLFKLKSTALFATMGENGTALGCDLSGEAK